MSVVMEFLNTVWGILSSLSPIGIDPLMFWLMFIMFFAVIFLLIQKVHIFEDNRGLAAIVSGVISFFAASSSFTVVTVSRLFPNLTVMIMFLIGLLIIVALVKPRKGDESISYGVLVIIASFFVVIWMTYSSMSPMLVEEGYISEDVSSFITPDNILGIGIVLFVILIFWLIFRTPKSKGTGADNFATWLRGK